MESTAAHSSKFFSSASFLKYNARYVSGTVSKGNAFWSVMFIRSILMLISWLMSNSFCSTSAKVASSALAVTGVKPRSLSVEVSKKFAISTNWESVKSLCPLRQSLIRLWETPIPLANSAWVTPLSFMSVDIFFITTWLSYLWIWLSLFMK